MKGKYHIRGAGAWASKKDFACMNTSLFTWERHLCNIPRATKAVNHECNKDDILVATKYKFSLHFRPRKFTDLFSCSLTQFSREGLE